MLLSKINKLNAYTTLLMLVVAVSGCTGANQQKPPSIDLYQNMSTSPWKITFKNHEKEQVLQDSSGELDGGNIWLKSMTQSEDNQALVLGFKNSWSSGLYLSGSQLDLSPYLNAANLEFDIKVDEIEKGKIDLIMNCERDCKHVYRLREWAQEFAGKGWQHLAIPLSCLLDKNDDLSAITQPFTLSTGGEGQLALANMTISHEKPSNMPCHTPIELATTAATLNEYWSVDWWLPRHAEKVAQAQLGEAKLVMIGDSITHGWENDGKEVWEKHFSDINTLNLGYGGDRTENVIWRLQHNELGTVNPGLIVMMIGTNNTGHRMDSPQAILAGVTSIVDELQSRAPAAKILLLEIFPRDAQPNSVMRLNNQAASDLIENLAKERGLLFANFNQAFLTADGVLTTDMMPDLLHPKALGYEIWAQQLQPYVEQYLR